MTVFYWASGWYYTWILGCLGWGSNRRHPAIYHLKSSVANGNYFLWIQFCAAHHPTLPGHHPPPSLSPGFIFPRLELDVGGNLHVSCFFSDCTHAAVSPHKLGIRTRQVSAQIWAKVSKTFFLFLSHILLLTHRMECNRGLCRWSGCWFSAAEARMWCWVGCGSRKPGWEDMAYEYIW